MSFSKIAAFTGALAFASKVAAHGTVTGIVADGVYYEGYHANFQYMQTQPVVVGWSTPEDQSNGFIAPDAYATSDIICHLGATNAKTSATVAAGGTVEMQWTAWPESHHGPVIDYLANCGGDCTTVDKTTLEFFKIDGVGLLDDTTVPGDWASDTLIANNNSWTVTIPSDIAPGNYVLRHEIIALHSAGTVDGAQNYPQCFNLEVTGSGTASPAGTLGTALYTETDPGIEVNIYTSLSTYVVPGPTLYSGAISMSQTSQPAATAIASVGTTADSVATTSAAASVATSASSAAGAASTVASSPSAGITSAAAAIKASSAPFTNGTSPSTKKSKSVCKAKTSKSSAIFSHTSIAGAKAVTSSVSSEVETTVTIPTSLPATTEAVQTKAAESTAAVSEVTVTGTSPATSTSTSSSGSSTSLPEGTTLSTVLAWISSFYEKVKGTSFNGDSTLARRQHARDVVPQFKAFDGVSVKPTGTGFGGFAHATGTGHGGHGHAHPTGSGKGFAKPTGTGFFGAQGVGAAQPTGGFGGEHGAHGTGHAGGARPTGSFSFSGESGSAQPTGVFPRDGAKPSGHSHHHHPHGTGVAGAGHAKPTGTGSFGAGNAKPTGAGKAQPTGASLFGRAKPSGHFGKHPHGTGVVGGSKPTGTGSFGAGAARPTGAGKFRMGAFLG
ncbi:glycosyl hydrolase family 61-domain-containing protein [Halenospora varia]|nr:glycosyl hydrolase family 61-domain-containing protein [Halenospora varia]